MAPAAAARPSSLGAVNLLLLLTAPEGTQPLAPLGKNHRLAPAPRTPFSLARSSSGLLFSAFFSSVAALSLCDYLPRFLSSFLPPTSLFYASLPLPSSDASSSCFLSSSLFPVFVAVLVSSRPGTFRCQLVDLAPGTPPRPTSHGRRPFGINRTSSGLAILSRPPLFFSFIS